MVRSTAKLPDPRGPLSMTVPSSSIESANAEVKRVIETEESADRQKRGHYEKFSPELRFQIGKRPSAKLDRKIFKDCRSTKIGPLEISCYTVLPCACARGTVASTPGSLGGGKREPGTHSLCMRQNLRKHLRKTIRLLLTSTWFIYVYVVYQVQIRRLNKYLPEAALCGFRRTTKPPNE